MPLLEHEDRLPLPHELPTLAEFIESGCPHGFILGPDAAFVK